MKRDPHFTALEGLYLDAPTNQYFKPSVRIEEGKAEIEIRVRDELMHAAQAVHGVSYFKVLDDACFFAVNSLVRDVFVLTASFNLYLTRPISAGLMRATGTVLHRSRRMFIAEAKAVDAEGNLIACGSGSFMRSKIALNAEVGYSLEE